MSDDHAQLALLAHDHALIRTGAADNVKRANCRVYRAADFFREVQTLQEAEDSIHVSGVELASGRLTGFDPPRGGASDQPHTGIQVSSTKLGREPGNLPSGTKFVNKPFTTDVICGQLQKLLPDGKQAEPLMRRRNRMV